MYCCGFQDNSQCVFMGRRSSSENTSTPHRGDPQLYQTSTRGMSTIHTHHFIKCFAYQALQNCVYQLNFLL